MVITFLTDFGLTDDFVGVCHGVMKRIAPDSRSSTSHTGSRRKPYSRAPSRCEHAPVHACRRPPCRRRPGCRTGRRALALRSGDGRFFVGPDNGLLLPAAERLGGIDAAHELTNPEYMLEPVSRTFHGRDVFSPAAAHLASGVDPGEFGPPLHVDMLVRLDIPEPDVSRGRVRATVIDVDRFGNVQLNLHREHLETAGIEPGRRVELELALDRYYAVAARTFADAGRATSCSTRTRTGTSRSRSTAGTPPRCSA